METHDKTPSIYEADTHTHDHLHANMHTHMYTHIHTHTHTAVHSHPLSTPSTAHQSTALQGRLAYRRAIVQRLIPALRAFSPGLILISAGFDGAQG